MSCLFIIFFQLRKMIREKEDGLVSEQAWTMTGETTHAKRPHDSGLYVDLEFDQQSKKGMHKQAIMFYSYVH